MKRRISAVFAAFVGLALFVVTASAQKPLMGGVGKSDITPPIGTPLAGYGARQAKPPIGVHDPTEARALVIDNGVEKIAFLSVDHLGYDHGMVQRVRAIAAKTAHILPDHIFVMSSHTHSGGGAFMELLPPLANAIAGKFDAKIRALYEQRAAEAIIEASKTMKPARIAFGAGEAMGISRFRSTWPPNGPVDPEVGVIRVDSAATEKPNDALGYIISEDEYRHRTYESTISLFVPTFGSMIVNEAFHLLEKLRPVEKKKP